MSRGARDDERVSQPHDEPLIAPTAPTITQPNQALGLALAAIGAALFATKGIFVKLALAEGLDAVSILTWRMLLSVPVFAVVGLIAYRGRRAGKGAHGGERSFAPRDPGLPCGHSVAIMAPVFSTFWAWCIFPPSSIA